MEWLNEPGEWAAVTTIVIALLTGLTWLIRTEVRGMRATTKQLLPNGGKSVADKVDLIAQRQSEIVTDIRELRHALNEHNDRSASAHARLHERIDDHVQENHLKRRK